MFTDNLGFKAERRLEAIFLFMIFYALNILLLLKLPELLASHPIFEKISYDLISALIQLSIFLVTVCVLKIRGFTFSESAIKMTKKRFLFIFMAMTLLVVLGDSISEWLKNYYFPVPYTLEKLPLSPALMIEFLVAVVLAPLTEEILFRGLLLKYVFANHWLLGLLVSSVLFVLPHSPQNWTSWLYYGLPGLIWGGTYLATKCLKIPILSHLVMNLLSFLRFNFL